MKDLIPVFIIAARYGFSHFQTEAKISRLFKYF